MWYYISYHAMIFKWNIVSMQNEKLTCRKGSLVIEEITKTLELREMALTAKTVRPFRSM